MAKENDADTASKRRPGGNTKDQDSKGICSDRTNQSLSSSNPTASHNKDHWLKPLYVTPSDAKSVLIRSLKEHSIALTTEQVDALLKLGKSVLAAYKRLYAPGQKPPERNDVMSGVTIPTWIQAGIGGRNYTEIEYAVLLALRAITTSDYAVRSLGWCLLGRSRNSIEERMKVLDSMCGNETTL